MQKYFGNDLLKQLNKTIEIAQSIKSDCLSEEHAPELEDSWKEIIDKYDKVINQLEKAKADFVTD